MVAIGLQHLLLVASYNTVINLHVPLHCFEDPTAFLWLIKHSNHCFHIVFNKGPIILYIGFFSLKTYT